MLPSSTPQQHGQDTPEFLTLLREVRDELAALRDDAGTSASPARLSCAVPVHQLAPIPLGALGTAGGITVPFRPYRGSVTRGSAGLFSEARPTGLDAAATADAVRSAHERLLRQGEPRLSALLSDGGAAEPLGALGATGGIAVPMRTRMTSIRRRMSSVVSVSPHPAAPAPAAAADAEAGSGSAALGGDAASRCSPSSETRDLVAQLQAMAAAQAGAQTRVPQRGSTLDAAALQLARRKAARAEHAVRSDARFVLLPDCTARRAWELSVALALVAAGVLSPLLAAFAPELGVPRHRAAWRALALLVHMQIVADVPMSFRKAIVREGVYVTAPRAIAAHYAGSRAFAMDVLAALPLRLCLAGGLWRGLEGTAAGGHITAWPAGAAAAAGAEGAPPGNDSLLFELVCLWDLLKLAKLYGLLSAFEGPLVPALVNLCRMCLVLSFVWLWMGCLWWYVGRAEEERLDSEGRPRTAFGPHNFVDLEAASAALRVSRALLWGVSVTSGLGPDVEPETLAEVALMGACSLLSISVYAVVIGSASTAISNLQAPQLERRRALAPLNDYMRQARVPERLRARVNSFFEYRAQSLLGLAESDVLDRMPVSLSVELSIALNARLFTRVPLFSACEHTLLLAMVARLEPLIFVPGDVIITQGEEGRALYFINRGTCLVLHTARALDRAAAPPRSTPRAEPGADEIASPCEIASPRNTSRSKPSRPAVSSSRAPWPRDSAEGLQPRRVRTPPVPPPHGARRRQPAAQPAPQARVLAVLAESDFFGERAMLSECQTAATVQAVTFADLSMLQRTDFEDVCKSFPTFAAQVRVEAARLERTAAVAAEHVAGGAPAPAGSLHAVVRVARLMGCAAGRAAAAADASDGPTSTRTTTRMAPAAAEEHAACAASLHNWTGVDVSGRGAGMRAHAGMGARARTVDGVFFDAHQCRATAAMRASQQTPDEITLGVNAATEGSSLLLSTRCGRRAAAPMAGASTSALMPIVDL